MRVVCDACQAKYQIPDERVAGRKLKIRCRKCGQTILVRGEHLVDSSAPALRGGDAQSVASAPSVDAVLTASEIEWHLSIDGEQHGPYGTEQMVAMLRGGQVSWDAFVWREGYGDWKLAGDSDTLVRRVSALVSAGADDEPTAAVAAPGLGIGDEDPTRMAQSPTHESLAPVARAAFAARSASRGSQPPFVGGHESFMPEAASQPPVGGSYAARGASQPPVASYSGNGVASQAPAYAGPHIGPMTAQRHEDSVLFSARNLALTASSGAAVAPSALPGGYASGEGSGIIDIRALAALAHTTHSVPATQTNGHNGSAGARPDAMLTMANQTGAFTRLDSLAPIDRPSLATGRAVPIAILAGSAMIAAAAFVAVYISRPSSTQPVSAAVAPIADGVPAPEPLPAAAPEREPTAAAEAPAAAPVPEPVAAPEPAAGARVDRGPARPDQAEARSARASRSSAKHDSPRSHRRSGKHESVLSAAKAAEKPAGKDKPSIDDLLLDDKKAEAKAGPAKAEKPEPAATPDDDLLAGPMPAPAKAKQPAQKRSIDDLLDDAVTKGKPGSGAAAPAAAALPESPTREQVLAAMRGVESDVKACAQGQNLDTQTAQVAISVAGATGRVSSVRVTGIQGSVGSCIARAVRGAAFPKFAKPQLSINFPFKLQ